MIPVLENGGSEAGTYLQLKDEINNWIFPFLQFLLA